MFVEKEVLGVARTPDGGAVRLIRHGDRLVIKVDGQVLMSSRKYGSETAMAKIACDPLKDEAKPRVLVSGLGLGYTLRAALDRLPEEAEVVCVELVASIAEWHLGEIGHLADYPIQDRRVKLVIGDVVRTIADLPPEQAFDAIMLDVDNGPIPLTSVGNFWLYAAEGLAALYAALRPKGTLVVWSVDYDARFEQRMCDAGLETETLRVTANRGRLARRRRGETHVLFIGRRP